MLHKNFLMISLLIPLFLLSACARPEPEKQIVTVPTIIKQDIPKVARPKPVSLIAPKIYVVNADNYEEFTQNFKEKFGELVYIAISIKDYENLSLNIAELRRYINQQKEVIVYYEDAIQSEQPADGADG